MALQSGDRLGPYEIVAPLGAGGMGEVYKARDTRLERVVAVKILSSALVGDTEFRDRFEREARTISQLTHPHICVLHDIGRHEDTDFLVMEYLDGESLAARLEKGTLKLEDALRVGAQIARALHAAHRVGIVHRDLKPGNVMLVKGAAGVARSPHAKLLDFGLAKHGPPLAHTGSAGFATAASMTAPPTMTSPLTMRGSIVGTLHYMAPEQLEGGDADARSDMFAFGAVLYEMLCGRKAFTGKSQVSVMAAILDHDPPPVASLVPTVPAALDRLIGKCLAKDPEMRWQSAGDVASELEWIADTPASPSAGDAPTAERTAEIGALQRAAFSLRRKLAAAVIVAGVAGITAMGLVWRAWSTPPVAPAKPVRFAIVQPAAQPLDLMGIARDFAISADGARVAFTALVAGQRTLMARAMDQLEAVPVRGAANPRAPFFSPDGKSIGYFDGPTLKTISIAGGPPTTLCRVSGAPRGASWGSNGTIVFSTGDSAGLLAVPASGGEPKPLTTVDVAAGERYHFFPSVLPDGQVIFTIMVGTLDSARIAVVDPRTGQKKILIRGATSAEYAASGHLVYATAGTLRAVLFDLGRLEVSGDPIPALDESISTNALGDFSLSRSGVLAYVPGGSTTGRTLGWIARDGREEPLAAPPRAYSLARISPDATRVVLQIDDQENDLWILDLSRQPPPLTRLTFDPATDTAPAWTPDGKRIVFRSARTPVANLFWHFADGTGSDERLTESTLTQAPLGFSPDGRRIVVAQSAPKTGVDLVTIAADGKGAPEPLVTTPFTEIGGEISPDGHWFAYHSNESGGNEVYVRPFPDTNGGRWQISTAGGSKPVWSRSGRELFYLDASNSLTAVPVETTPSFRPGTPAKVSDARFYTVGPGRNWDVAPDGRFLVIKNARSEQAPNDTPAGIVVVLNWTEELKARLSNR